jgi:hypothetical protein
LWLVKEELYAIADSLGDHDYDHSKVHGMYGKREELSHISNSKQQTL